MNRHIATWQGASGWEVTYESKAYFNIDWHLGRTGFLDRDGRQSGGQRVRMERRRKGLFGDETRKTAGIGLQWSYRSVNKKRKSTPFEL